MTEQLKQDLEQIIAMNRRLWKELQNTNVVTPETQLKTIHKNILESLLSVIKAQIPLKESDD